MASIVRAYPLSPSVHRVAPRKARLPAQPAWQPLREEPHHGARSRHTVPGHGNYLCVTIATWLRVLLCDPAAPLPGASRTGRASSLPCSRYPITQLLPVLWLSPAPGGHMGVPSCEGGGRWRAESPVGPGAQT